MQKVWTTLILGFAAVLLNVAHAAFPGGSDPLIEAATAWISEHTSHSREEINVSAPDRRIAIEPCDQPLAFRFPFENNLRTVEAVCAQPQWKRFLRVNIEIKPQVVVARDDLQTGNILTAEDLILGPTSDVRSEGFSSIELLVGQTLLQAVSAGTEIQPDMVGQARSAYRTTRAYQIGETIQLDDLLLEKAISDSVDSALLTTWPGETMVVLEAIEAGRLIEKTQVSRATRVLVAAENLIPGQVITAAMVREELRPQRQFGQTPLSRAEQAIGFETTRTIRAGSPLSEADLMAADLVRKGERVQLIIQRGALVIRADTLALEPGKLGDQVTLQNLESGQMIQGIVTGRREATGIR